LLSFAVFAEGEEGITQESAFNQMFYNEISSQLYFPDEARSMGLEGFVLVSFEIGANGDIEILEMNSSDMIFYNAAKESLSNILLCSHAQGNVYNMQFNYKLY